MTDQELIRLIRARGVMWVARATREGVVPALDEGIDLTGWHCNAAAGAVLFYQVEHPPHAGQGGIFRSAGAGAPPPPPPITTDAPRVMCINGPRTPEMAQVVMGAKTDASVTVLYSDGTEEQVGPTPF